MVEVTGLDSKGMGKKSLGSVSAGIRKCSAVLSLNSALSLSKWELLKTLLKGMVFPIERTA